MHQEVLTPIAVDPLRGYHVLWPDHKPEYLPHIILTNNPITYLYLAVKHPDAFTVSYNQEDIFKTELPHDEFVIDCACFKIFPSG